MRTVGAEVEPSLAERRLVVISQLGAVEAHKASLGAGRQARRHERLPQPARHDECQQDEGPKRTCEAVIVRVRELWQERGVRTDGS